MRISAQFISSIYRPTVVREVCISAYVEHHGDSFAWIVLGERPITGLLVMRLEHTMHIHNQ